MDFCFVLILLRGFAVGFLLLFCEVSVSLFILLTIFLFLSFSMVRMGVLPLLLKGFRLINGLHAKEGG